MTKNPRIGNHSYPNKSDRSSTIMGTSTGNLSFASTESNERAPSNNPHTALPSINQNNPSPYPNASGYSQNLMGVNPYSPYGSMQLQSQMSQLTPQMVASNDTNSQAASKGRLRVSKACDRCRNQKIKCLGTMPCNSCVRHKKECKFSSQLQSHIQAQALKNQKLNDPSFETYGLPIVSKTNDKSYVDFLENRVQYLENLLADDSKSVFKSISNTKQEDMPDDGILYAPSSKWRYLRRHQKCLVVDLCKKLYDSLTDDLKKSVSIPRNQYFGWNMSGTTYATTDNLPEHPIFSLSEDSMFYIDFFFKEINPLFAILHETVFREQMDAYNALVNEERKLSLDNEGHMKEVDSKTNQTRLFTAMLYLVYALSIRFIEFQKQEGPSLDQLNVEKTLFKYSHQVISILSFEWEAFELVQSWLLITLYLRITHRQNSSYHALGQALTMTKSMGLGQNYHRLKVASPYEQSKAKRIFWSVYTMDRVLGLQYGRYCGLGDADVTLKFPSMKYDEESEKDDWITLPAFAMIHIARVANFVHTSATDNPMLIKYQQINLQLSELKDWLEVNGFSNEQLYNPNLSDEVSSVVKTQVRLHYYDLVNCIHGKVLLNFIGRKIANPGLKISMVLDSCQGIVDVLEKTKEAGFLYTPWYSVLLLLFNAGVYAITLISTGLLRNGAKEVFKKVIDLLNVIQSAAVINSKGRVLIKERFTMAKECSWALKMANHMLSLRLQEDVHDLNEIGINHGSADVNKEVFSQFGKDADKQTSDDSKDQFSEVFNRKVHKSIKGKGFDKVPDDTSNTPSTGDELPNLLHDNDLFANLQWFDQWLDFGYDI
ncbi:uncharacterized protein PRCAT00003639001 [Priceomyces carsonii]|uniref:uncharacterized protein n=1 Tax=Priceomyces carsonii TaxID=28549 RepID=UPI002EDA9FAA|nr:unnamed protein product [Priceomyces carsonii]